MGDLNNKYKILKSKIDLIRQYKHDNPETDLRADILQNQQAKINKLIKKKIYDLMIKYNI